VPCPLPDAQRALIHLVSSSSSSCSSRIRDADALIGIWRGDKSVSYVVLRRRRCTSPGRSKSRASLMPTLSSLLLPTLFLDLTFHQNSSHLSHCKSSVVFTRNGNLLTVLNADSTKSEIRRRDIIDILPHGTERKNWEVTSKSVSRRIILPKFTKI